MELTKEYFEQHLAEKLAPLATKQDVREGVEELARIIAETVATPMEQRFADLEEHLDVTERIQKIELTIESKFSKLEEALHIKL